jgi:hypothetical protein
VLQGRVQANNEKKIEKMMGKKKKKKKKKKKNKKKSVHDLSIDNIRDCCAQFIGAN